MEQELLEFRRTFVNSSSIIVFIPLGIQNTFTSGEVCSHLGRYQRHGRTDRQRWTLWKCKNCLFNQYPTIPKEAWRAALLGDPSEAGDWHASFSSWLRVVRNFSEGPKREQNGRTPAWLGGHVSLVSCAPRVPRTYFESSMISVENRDWTAPF